MPVIVKILVNSKGVNMKVEITRNKESDTGVCKITREPGDHKFYRGYGWDQEQDMSESRLLHAVKQELIKQGHDIIKKRAWKDGHMVSDTLHYLRTRDRKKGFMIWDDQYALRSIAEEFNQDQEVFLAVEFYS